MFRRPKNGSIELNPLVKMTRTAVRGNCVLVLHWKPFLSGMVRRE